MSNTGFSIFDREQEVPWTHYVCDLNPSHPAEPIDRVDASWLNSSFSVLSWSVREDFTYSGLSFLDHYGDFQDWDDFQEKRRQDAKDCRDYGFADNSNYLVVPANIHPLVLLELVRALTTI